MYIIIDLKGVLFLVAILFIVWLFFVNAIMAWLILGFVVIVAALVAMCRR